MNGSTAGVNRARRLGYRMAGPAFDYVLHLRPAEWPIMAGHTSLGYLLGVGIPGALRGERLGALGLGLLIWVLFLNGGTLAINSAFDRDEGDIGYLHAPPPPPAGLGLFSFVLLASGQALALLLPRPFALAYAAGFGMSLVYSVPPFRWKAIAGLDWVINMVGFGTLTPFAGYALTGLMPGLAHWLVLLGFCPLFASLYPLTQLYQFEEDQRRGDRTFALILGMRRSLLVAIVAAAVAFGIFAAAGIAAGWGAGFGDLARWGGLLLAGGTWAGVLGPWLRRHREMVTADHQQGMYAALRAWAVTDVVVILAWGFYT